MIVMDKPQNSATSANIADKTVSNPGNGIGDAGKTPDTAVARGDQCATPMPDNPDTVARGGKDAQLMEQLRVLLSTFNSDQLNRLGLARTGLSAADWEPMRDVMADALFKIGRWKAAKSLRECRLEHGATTYAVGITAELLSEMSKLLAERATITPTAKED